MTKSVRNLIILAAALVVCVGAYIAVTQITAAQEKKTAEASADQRVYSSDMTAPVKISFTAGGKTLAFVQQDGKWIVSGDASFPLDQTLVGALASSISGLTCTRSFEPSSELSAYGLDKPATTLEATDAQGKTFMLLIGGVTNDDNYAKLSSGTTIYTVASSFVSSLKTDVLSFIALDNLPAMTGNTMKSVTLTGGSKTLTLEKETGSDGTSAWYIVAGGKKTAAADYTFAVKSDKSASEYITQLVSALSSAAYSSCAYYQPDSASLESSGLGTGKTTVTVVYTETSDTNSSDKTVSFDLGAATSDGTGYYAQNAGSAQIDILPATTVTPLTDALAALGSMA